jgi:hypothetical protein
MVARATRDEHGKKESVNYVGLHLTVIPALKRFREEDYKFLVSLHYRVER